MKNKLIVIAPALSPAVCSESIYQRAEENLNQLGLQIQWAPAARKALEENQKDQFESSLLSERVNDINWAVQSEVEVILAAVGGYNSYQLLDQIDWRQLAKNGKILVGHSDLTVLFNAYYALTGRLSWYGPNFRNLGDSDTGLLSAENLAAALSKSKVKWLPPPIYKDTFNAKPKKSQEWQIIRPGKASGTGIGGNIGSFFLLQGTRYMPKFDNPTILFLEEDEMPGIYAVREFDRKLRSILDQPGARSQIKGLIIGRFLDETKTSMDVIRNIIDEINFFADKPVMANVEIGHGTPRILLSIGGQIEIDTAKPSLIVYSRD